MSERTLAEQTLAELDKRFALQEQRYEAKLEELRRESAERSETVDKRFDSADERFASIDERFDSIDERFDSVEAQQRYTLVMLEDVRSSVQLLAEAVAGINDKLDRWTEEAASQRRRDQADTDIKLRALRSVDEGLDRRVTRLEAQRRPQT